MTSTEVSYRDSAECFTTFLPYFARMKGAAEPIGLTTYLTVYRRASPQRSRRASLTKIDESRTGGTVELRFGVTVV